jgi:hypothetical protein
MSHVATTARKKMRPAFAERGDLGTGETREVDMMCTREPGPPG